MPILYLPAAEPTAHSAMQSTNARTTARIFFMLLFLLKKDKLFEKRVFFVLPVSC